MPADRTAVSVRRENKKLRMICLPKQQNNNVKFICFVVSPVLHDSKLGGVKPSVKGGVAFIKAVPVNK
jgi:hypothetical protein